MFKVLVVVLLIIGLAAALRRPMNPSAKNKVASAPPKGKASVAQPAKAKKDMTWGGRPNPTPETRVDNSKSFLFADWRLGRGYKNKGAQQ